MEKKERLEFKEKLDLINFVLDKAKDEDTKKLREEFALMHKDVTLEEFHQLLLANQNNL